MAMSVSSSASISASLSTSRTSNGATGFKAPLIGSYQPLDRVNLVSVSYSTKRRVFVNAESKCNDSIVPLAATIIGPGTEEIEKVGIFEEEVNFDQLAKDLENASPLEIMDRAFENSEKTSPLLLACYSVKICMKMNVDGFVSSFIALFFYY